MTDSSSNPNSSKANQTSIQDLTDNSKSFELEPEPQMHVRDLAVELSESAISSWSKERQQLALDDEPLAADDSTPIPPYVQLQHIGTPFQLRTQVFLASIGHVAAIGIHTLALFIYWTYLLSMDAAAFAANLVLPQRQKTQCRPMDQSFFFQRYVPRFSVLPAFSPQHPPSFWQAPVTCFLCHVAASFNLWYIPLPEWLMHWTMWSGIGHLGDWGVPDWPNDDDSRGPCPALNALANHGILPHDGRCIHPHQLAANVSRAFNLSPSLSLMMVWLSRPLWYFRGTLDLEDLAAHNVYEHDASLLRPDQNSAEQVADPWAQKHPWANFVDALFPTPQVVSKFCPSLQGQLAEQQPRDDLEDDDSATSTLSLFDLSQALAIRRHLSQTRNPQYTQGLLHSIMGSMKIVFMRNVFAGRIRDLRCLSGGAYHSLSQDRRDQRERALSGLEHIPLSRWQPNNLQACGTSAIEALLYALVVEMAICTSAKKRVKQYMDQQELSSTLDFDVSGQLHSEKTEPTPPEPDQAGSESDDTLHEAWSEATPTTRSSISRKEKSVSFDLYPADVELKKKRYGANTN